MKVWKSPVFYFGVVLVLAVLSAMLAPFVVDWGSYRPQLEAYGEKLSGRKVEIAGPIEVRLFPWPKLTAHDVRIANPETFSDKWLAAANQVVVRMNLGAMLNGTIQVESISVENPAVKFRRTVNGEGNWNFKPSENIRNSRLLDQVMLDKITLTKGRLLFVDDRRESQVDLKNINATFSAANLAGPWRSDGTFDYGTAPLAFTFNAGEWSKDAPLTLGLHLSSRENTGYSYFLDGKTDGELLSGSLSIDPVQSAEGKSDTEGEIRPVTFRSKFTGSFEQVKLSDIEIRPAGASEQVTILSGNASFKLDRKVEATAEFSAPRMDFDALAGAGARRLLRDGGGLSLVNGLLAMLPDAIELRSAVKVSALKTGGETLENVLLDFSANRSAMRIHELSASLPGRSRALFSGVFFPGAQFAELGGKLDLESFDARQLSQFLWPDSKDEINRTWTGTRGLLKAKTEVKLTASKLELKDIDYELDGQRGKANLAVLVNGERPIIDLRIDAATADIDSYVPNGLAALSSDGKASWSRLIENFVDEQVQRDLRLTFQAGTLKLNGVEASDVAVDLETTIKGFDLKTIEAGSVGGSKLSAAGVVLSTPEGPDGAIGISLTAEDPREFLRLTGLLPRDKDPPWSSVLGRTALKINLQAKPSAAAPTTHYDVRGTIGDLEIASNGSFTLAVGLAGTGLKGVTEISSPSSAALINLFGGAVETPDAIPAKAVLTADGAVQEKFQVDLQGDIYHSTVQFRGTANPGGGTFALDGNLTVQSPEARELLAILKFPGVPAAVGQLSLSSKIRTEGNKQSFDSIEVKLADFAVSGSATMENHERLTGDFSVSDVSLVNVMAPVFLPWNGQAASIEEQFAKALPFDLTGEIWVRPKSLEVYPGLVSADSEIGITVTADETRFAVFAKSTEGDKFSVEFASNPALAGQKISGHLNLPIDVARQLKLADGTGIGSGRANIDVTFNGEGRSPGGVLATLNAEGTYALADGKLFNLSPESFSKLIVEAKDASGLEAAFSSLHSGDGITLGPASGILRVANGVATFTPFGATTADARVTVKPVAELADGKIDIGITLYLNALAQMPPMEISYSGSPQQLVAGEDRSALTSYLGFKVLEKSVDELEKVQQEQARIAIEEEKLRKEDEERLVAFYAQKAELRLRLREMKTQSDQRALDVELAKAEEIRRISEGEAINKQELRLRLRELRLFRKQLADAAKAVTPKEKPVPQPSIQVPFVIVPPARP